MIGRNNTQTKISTKVGNACTQLQIKSSHSRFKTSAAANPTQSTAKITTAYVLRIRAKVTFQNDESLIVLLLDQYKLKVLQENEHV